MEVFLGGTCNNSTWREQLIPLLEVDYFNPVINDWNEEAQELELVKRKTCNYLLYVVTPLMEGFYTIAELVDDSNKRPQKTLICFLEEDEEKTWTEHQKKSIKAIKKMVIENGSFVFFSLKEIAIFLNAVNKL